MTSLKQHKEYFHFRCKIELDLPVDDLFFRRDLSLAQFFVFPCRRRIIPHKLLSKEATAICASFAGSRNKRAQDAVTNIGPAVLNGCVSTFLSIILLADSNSSIFEVFFKVNKTATGSGPNF